MRQTKTPKTYRFGAVTLAALEFLMSHTDESETAVVQRCIQEAAERLKVKLRKKKQEAPDAE